MDFTKEEISIIIQALDSLIEQTKKANQTLTDKIDLIPLLSLMEKLNGK